MSLLLAYIFFKYMTFATIGQQLNLPVNSKCLLGSGDVGVCKRVDFCASARDMLMRHQRPIICSFEETSPFIPIVCCVPEKDLPYNPTLATFTFNPTTSGITRIPTPVSYPNQSPNQISNQIFNQISNQTPNQISNQTPNQISNQTPNQIPNPISNLMSNPLLNPISTPNPNQNQNLNASNRPQAIDTSIRIDGRKSAEKCAEYKRIEYKFPDKSLLTTTQAPYKEVIINPHKFITGGVSALPFEFPHVALLGYGEQSDIHWLSGGGLISENFILTAAHCLASDLYGAVTYVRLGELVLRTNDDDAYPVDYEVAETFEFPEYRADAKYHDIALIRLKKTVDFNAYIKPACIYIQREFPNNVKFMAAGWGRVYYGGTHYNDLQKVELNITAVDACSKTYTKALNGLERGVDFDTQICAEGADPGGDTCQGDSGTPLSFFQSQLYQIVGVTSFGINCGVAPAIYTRVFYYINWIEGIVWP